MFKRTKISGGVLLALGGMLLATSSPVMSQSQTIEVTGSRIKRADAEGALPVTVVTRAELEASGQATLAEFIRSSTFSSAGQFRPQSGSSAQSFSGVDLRGLGSSRTLVLVDGRRVAKAPNVGDSADMNSIPMAAVERIEILTDGASAIYGSDAIGGVVNVILRKDFEGIHVMYGETKPDIKGGDRMEASATIGLIGEKGRLIAGVSKTSRDIIFQRDYPWGKPPGTSGFSNTYSVAIPDPDNPGQYFQGGFLANAGSCDFPDRGFFVNAAGRCRFDFNLVGADEAATTGQSMFARGEVKVGKDWSAYLVASNTRTTSFGRYAPVPDNIVIQPGTPNARPGATQVELLQHRFAAAGNRDTSTDGNLYDISVGAQGTFAGFDIDVGARRTTSKIVETGRGFIVKSNATTAINDGSYNVADPFSNIDAVLKSISHTTGRESVFSSTEYYASASTSLFKMGTSAARLFVGAEHRTEDYEDLYDSLSEAGQVLGSAGSSAGGGRKVDALSAELLFPFSKTLEATLAARYEKYSDYGNDFSPKASLRWQPLSNVTFRASAGKGFAAPSLPILTQKPSFSADTVVDPRHCAVIDPTETDCANAEFQINGLRIASPTLTSEKSTQFSLGAVWDVTPALSLKVDYWNTQIKDVIRFISAQTIVNRDNGDDALPIPGGLKITRDASGQILQIVSGSVNEGTLDYSGIDLNVAFTHKYPSFGSFKHEVSLSQVLNAKINDNDFNGSFGTPKRRARIATSWVYGPVEATWNVNYIAGNGERDGDYAGGYTTHDVQVAWHTPLKGSKLTVGAVNAGGKLPALVGSPYDQKPFNYYLYDAYGSQYYVRAEMKF